MDGGDDVTQLLLLLCSIILLLSPLGLLTSPKCLPLEVGAYQLEEVLGFGN
jgi:hypothetical protein